MLARLKKGDKYVQVAIAKGRPVAPDDECYGYYLRYRENGKRILQPVGKEITAAFVAFQNRELNLTRLKMGLAPVHDVPVGNGSLNDRVRISDAVASYVQNLTERVQTGEAARGTLRGYKNAVEDFRDYSGVTFLDEVTGDVLKTHKAYLYANMPKRIRGKQSNTVAKRFRFLNAFFAKQGIQMMRDRNWRPGDAGLIARSDVPREEKKQNIDKYSAEEINDMLSVATEDQADLIHFFLRTGCRDEEAAYLHWTDVDFKRQQIVIDDKPKFEWRPKDKERRSIPVEDGVLLKRLEARKKRQKPANQLVFPNTLGTPDMHLIRQLHKVVAKMKKAGLEIEGVPDQHRFRRTYASMMIGHSDLQTVSKLLGHSDIETTARYLAPDEEKARKGTRTAFESVNK
ncbi:MAG TPA: tyrosine-type recombinase/integrase [Candidatus Acidoferrales bacterium]